MAISDFVIEVNSLLVDTGQTDHGSTQLILWLFLSIKIELDGIMELAVSSWHLFNNHGFGTRRILAISSDPDGSLISLLLRA